MSDKQPMPDFPNVAGARFISGDDRKRISEAAWAQSNGSVRAFEQLCAEHARGEIDLFSDAPTAIRLRGSSPAPGSDRFTATGGETGSEAGAAPAPQSAPSVSQTAAAAPPAPSTATTGTAAATGTVAGVGSVTNTGTVVEPPGSITNEGTAGV